MLLEPLVSVLAEVKERLQRHNQELRQSEALTRSALIDPVLRALGWNTEDPDLARPEYRVRQVRNERVNYALLSPGGVAAAFIEAKSLGQSLEQDRDIDQLLRYAFADGIPYGVLTNGNNWHVYDLKMPGGVAMRERRTLETSIADAEPHECALRLLYLWRPNLASGQPAPANVPPRPVAAPVVTPTPTPAGNIPASASWTPVSRVNPAPRSASAQAIRFPDGEVRQVENWPKTLAELADWLVINGYLSSRQCPISSLGFINSEPRDVRGSLFRHYEQVSGGIYVNVNLTANTLAKYMRDLLNHFNINPETVELSFR